MEYEKILMKSHEAIISHVRFQKVRVLIPTGVAYDTLTLTHINLSPLSSIGVVEVYQHIHVKAYRGVVKYVVMYVSLRVCVSESTSSACLKLHGVELNA